MAEKTSFPHPYRSVLFVLAIGGALAAMVLGFLAGTVRDDPAGAASVWVWAGHAVTLAIVAGVGELVLAGILWRPPFPGETTADD
jgi:hypothetical protein